jgi:pimeloyl-ACP methyl ester carboxylesterase
LERLNYQTLINKAGNPWLIFIHGAGGGIKTWKYQVDYFSSDFNILLMDLRDHGKSKNILPERKQYTFQLICEDILKVLDHLEIKEGYFISLSLGSMVLQKLALMRPGLLKGAVIAGGLFHVNWKIMAFANTANFLTKFLPYRWMYQLFSRLVMPRANHAASRQVFIEQSRKLSAQEYDRWVTLYRDFRNVLSEYYHEPLTYPLLIVMGGEDYIFLEAAKRYADYHPDAQLHVIPNCGHICNIEKHEEFNEIAFSFLSRSYRNALADIE